MKIIEGIRTIPYACGECLSTTMSQQTSAHRVNERPWLLSRSLSCGQLTEAATADASRWIGG